MIYSRRTIRNLVGWVGLCLGLIVAVVLPVGYALVAYSQLGHQLSLLAELKACVPPAPVAVEASSTTVTP